MVELTLITSAAIAVILVVLLVGFLIWRRKHKASRGTNYKTFLTMGIAWLAVGLIYMFYRPGPDGINPLFALGIIFFIVGLGGMLMGWIEKNKSAANKVV